MTVTLTLNWRSSSSVEKRVLMSVVSPNPDSPGETNSTKPSHLPINRKRTNNHNGEVPTTFCDESDLMPVSQSDASVCMLALRRCSQTWLGRLAMPIPSREGAGLAIVVLGREVGATGTLTTLVWLYLLSGKIQGSRFSINVQRSCFTIALNGERGKNKIQYINLQVSCLSAQITYFISMIEYSPSVSVFSRIQGQGRRIFKLSTIPVYISSAYCHTYDGFKPG